jgi:hypothetical protein
MGVSRATDIARFFEVLKIRYGYEQGMIFKKLFEDYTNLLLEYNINLIEKGVEEISAGQEDDKNFFNLLELNNKKGMNADLFNILYNLLISTKKQNKYANYMT